MLQTYIGVILSDERTLYSIQYKNGYLAASDHFPMFTQSIKFYSFLYDILRKQMFEKGDSLNRQ